MKQRPRIYYSASQKALMWERWKKGWTLHEIGKLFDRGHSSIHRIIAETGGIRPPDRKRSRLALTLVEREEISLGLAIGHSIRSIAAQIGRAPSTVSREIERNGGRIGYRAAEADSAAWSRANRPKTCKLVQESGDKVPATGRSGWHAGRADDLLRRALSRDGAPPSARRRRRSAAAGCLGQGTAQGGALGGHDHRPRTREHLLRGGGRGVQRAQHRAQRMAVDPLGVVVARAVEGPTLVMVEGDPARVAHARRVLPVLQNRRFDKPVLRPLGT